MQRVISAANLKSDESNMFTFGLQSTTSQRQLNTLRIMCAGMGKERTNSLRASRSARTIQSKEVERQQEMAIERSLGQQGESVEVDDKND